MRALFMKSIPALIFLICTAVISGDGVDKKGVVTYAQGQVKRSSGESENWQNAPVNTDILSGDKVRTYQDSRAELNLAQLDIIRLAQRTIVDIVQLYQETKEKVVKTEIKVEEGEIWANVEKVKMNAKFDLSAPVAAAAITGTVLRFKVESDSTTQLKVYNGEVHITNAPENKKLKPQSIVPHEIPGPYEIPGPTEISMEEWLYIVKSMEQITIDSKGQIVSKGQFNDQDLDEQNDWISWNKNRDRWR